MQKLINHNWPGNIRELENVVRRLVLVNNEQYAGKIVQLFARMPDDIFVQQGQSSFDEDQEIKTWENYQRDYILFVLRKCKGKISGENGAAKFLNLPPSTLESKIKKLGIKKNIFTD